MRWRAIDTHYTVFGPGRAYLRTKYFNLSRIFVSAKFENANFAICRRFDAWNHHDVALRKNPLTILSKWVERLSSRPQLNDTQRYNVRINPIEIQSEFRPYLYYRFGGFVAVLHMSNKRIANLHILFLLLPISSYLFYIFSSSFFSTSVLQIYFESFLFGCARSPYQLNILLFESNNKIEEKKAEKCQ